MKVENYCKQVGIDVFKTTVFLIETASVWRQGDLGEVLTNIEAGDNVLIYSPLDITVSDEQFADFREAVTAIGAVIRTLYL